MSLFFVFYKEGNIRVMYVFSLNLGDNLNYFLLNDMANAKIDFYDRTFIRPNNEFWDQNNIKKMDEISKINLFFIGSTLDTICNWSYIFHDQNKKSKTILSKWYYKIQDYFNPLKIYGTGFISSKNYKNESYIRNIKVIAVRGNITLKRLKNNGVKVSKDTFLADPGILAPMLKNIIDIDDINITRKYNLCIIPHYIDFKNELIKSNIQVNNSIILNINTNPYKFIEYVSKCKSILSSGLHGLIIADSLGIPNQRFVVSNLIDGGGYKFIDYYSAYGLKVPQAIDLRKKKFTEKDLVFLKTNYDYCYTFN